MIKILTIVGTRPQIIKSFSLSKEIRSNFSNLINEIIVHTGQHYDEKMSEIFYKEINLALPKYEFKLDPNHKISTLFQIIFNLEEIVKKEKPNAILVYGDTNSTFAGAYIASKLNIKLLHVEAGLRSYDKNMPEELNRIFTDHLSSILFCPTKSSVKNLEIEGIFHSNGSCSMTNKKVYLSGDIMYDNLLHNVTKKNKNILRRYKLKNFCLLTFHRKLNTNNKYRLKKIVNSLVKFSETFKKTLFFPIHPRTKKYFKLFFGNNSYDYLLSHKFFKIIDPISYTEMISIIQNCDLVITDSGGIQKEAYLLEKPSIIIRNETEWIEILENGSSVLWDLRFESFVKSYEELLNNKLKFQKLFGNGNSANFICDKIIDEIR